MGDILVNKKMGLLVLLGLLLFLIGIYISQWTLLGIVIGTVRGCVVGFSSVKLIKIII